MLLDKHDQAFYPLGESAGIDEMAELYEKISLESWIYRWCELSERRTRLPWGFKSPRLTTRVNEIHTALGDAHHVVHILRQPDEIVGGNMHAWRNVKSETKTRDNFEWRVHRNNRIIVDYHSMNPSHTHIYFLDEILEKPWRFVESVSYAVNAAPLCYFPIAEISEIRPVHGYRAPIKLDDTMRYFYDLMSKREEL